MIEWKGGAACFAGGWQWEFNDSVKPYSLACCSNGDASLEALSSVINFKDFQLNEIREGDYIEASELDTEQKYNDAVAVFGLFGFEWSSDFKWAYFRSSTHKQIYIDENRLLLGFRGKRKITYSQLMAIGKLKRAMIERDEVERGKLKHSVRFKSPPLDVSGFNTVEQSREKRARRNKSKQAYAILKSSDYEYDLVKQRWYKKAYI